MEENQPLNPKEIAKYLRISENTVYRLLNSGKIPGTKIGWVWRVRKQDIDEYLTSKITYPKENIANDLLLK